METLQLLHHAKTIFTTSIGTKFFQSSKQILRRLGRGRIAILQLGGEGGGGAPIAHAQLRNESSPTASMVATDSQILHFELLRDASAFQVST